MVLNWLKSITPGKEARRNQGLSESSRPTVHAKIYKEEIT